MDTILGSNLTKNRKGMVKILNLLKDICFRGLQMKNQLKKQIKNQTNIPYTIDMLRLENEESAAKERTQKGQELKTPSQMLSRLRISLTELKAGNSYKKLKNEIR